MKITTKPLAIYTTKGDAAAFLVYPYLYNQMGDWIGWVTAERDVYSVLGYYVGKLASPLRILRKRADDENHKHLNPIPKPPRMAPPATVPLPPMMPEIGFDTIDVLMDEPERLHAPDSGDLRQDMD